jgi:ribosomal protein S18 acetylase RimI-like enzyme
MHWPETLLTFASAKCLLIVEDQQTMNIRPAKTQDAEALSALINSSAHHFLIDSSGRGAERFLEGITPQAILGYITSSNFYYLIAEDGTNLAGAVALRDGRHLFHLFVAPAYQQRGLARALWEAAKQGASKDLKIFTVNSSPNAVAVYKRFGFTTNGPRTEKNGIAFVPMEAAATAGSSRH